MTLFSPASLEIGSLFSTCSGRNEKILLIFLYKIHLKRLKLVILALRIKFKIKLIVPVLGCVIKHRYRTIPINTFSLKNRQALAYPFYVPTLTNIQFNFDILSTLIMTASIQLIEILSSTSIQWYKISYKKKFFKQTKQNCNSYENCNQSSNFELDKSENLVAFLFKVILFQNY